ncbi:MAG: DUF2237 family protein [Lautropia sp.]
MPTRNPGDAGAPDSANEPHDLARARNVLGGPLAACSYSPVTGYFRDGCCNTDDSDIGNHTVCARVTEAFLAFSREQGNDLSTPAPQYRFAGLSPGDRWCLCARRWLDALDAGMAPPVVLEATHEAALRVIPLDVLLANAWPKAGVR